MRAQYLIGINGWIIKWLNAGDERENRVQNFRLSDPTEGSTFNWGQTLCQEKRPWT